MGCRSGGHGVTRRCPCRSPRMLALGLAGGGTSLCNGETMPGGGEQAGCSWERQTSQEAGRRELDRDVQCGSSRASEPGLHAQRPRRCSGPEQGQRASTKRPAGAQAQRRAGYSPGVGEGKFANVNSRPGLLRPRVRPAPLVPRRPAAGFPQKAQCEMQGVGVGRGKPRVDWGPPEGHSRGPRGGAVERGGGGGRRLWVETGAGAGAWGDGETPPSLREGSPEAVTRGHHV